jgi:hypothetical protein
MCSLFSVTLHQDRTHRLGGVPAEGALQTKQMPNRLIYREVPVNTKGLPTFGPTASMRQDWWCESSICSHVKGEVHE